MGARGIVGARMRMSASTRARAGYISILLIILVKPLLRGPLVASVSMENDPVKIAHLSSSCWVAYIHVTRPLSVLTLCANS